MQVFYGLFWLVRLNGCVRRGRQPLLRGREWLFAVPVGPGFYAHEGRSLVIAQCGVIHLNHLLSVDRAEREARAFAIAEQPVTRVAVSLCPRRLRDHTNWMVEWGLVAACAGAFVWLTRCYITPPHLVSLRSVFGVPVLMVYMQFGMLLIKHVVVASPDPLPEARGAECRNVRQETLKYYLLVCDWCRMTMVAMIVFWPVRLSTPLSGVDRLIGSWFLAWLLIGVAATVWIEVKRRQLASLAGQARPVSVPNLQQSSPPWPVCYQPCAPLFMPSGARGYSLNVGHRLAYVGAAYCAGLAALFVLLPVQR